MMKEHIVAKGESTEAVSAIEKAFNNFNIEVNKCLSNKTVPMEDRVNSLKILLNNVANAQQKVREKLWASCSESDKKKIDAVYKVFYQKLTQAIMEAPKHDTFSDLFRTR